MIKAVLVSEHRNITPTSSEDLLLVTKKEKHLIRTSSSRGFLSKFAIEEVKGTLKQYFKLIIDYQSICLQFP